MSNVNWQKLLKIILIVLSRHFFHAVLRGVAPMIKQRGLVIRCHCLAFSWQVGWQEQRPGDLSLEGPRRVGGWGKWVISQYAQRRGTLPAECITSLPTMVACYNPDTSTCLTCTSTKQTTLLQIFSVLLCRSLNILPCTWTHFCFCT